MRCDTTRRQRVPLRRSHLLRPFVLTGVVATGLLTTSCGDAQTVTKAVPGPTVTVTVPGPTETVTVPGPTVTKKVTPSPSPTSLEASSPEASPAASDSGTPSSDFDRAYATDVAGDIIRDIKTVDRRLRDGIAVSSGLWLLSSQYGRLENAGTPSGVDAARYHARLRTLDAFASAASDIYDDNPMEGAAKYAVVREETGTLLGQLNSALGTDLRLP